MCKKIFIAEQCEPYEGCYQLTDVVYATKEAAEAAVKAYIIEEVSWHLLPEVDNSTYDSKFIATILELPTYSFAKIIIWNEKYGDGHIRIREVEVAN